MKRTTALLLFVLLLLSHVSAQSALDKNLRAHIAYLASDKLEGRRTGDPGATMAAKYIESEFKKSKLKPGLRTGFLQPFPYIAGVTLGTGNELVIGGKKLEVGTDWMPLGYSSNADIPSTEIVFAGFGVTAPEANYDDYKKIDAKDKIVLIFDSTPDAGNPHSAFTRFDIHTKANVAKDHGAKAIILIAEDRDFKNDRVSRLVYDRTLGETALPVVGISRAAAVPLFRASDEASLDRLEKYSVGGLPPPPSPREAQAETRPVGRVSLTTGQVKINLAKKTVDAYNVIGILPGTDPQLKNEAMIIGAHYDHLGHGGSGSLAINSTDIHHGADDNASGTAAVIELAKQFAKDKKNKRTLIFMTFSGEEEGLLGSKYYVNNPVWPLEKTIAMINLDMVGRLNENKLTIGGIGTASEWKNLIPLLNKTFYPYPTIAGSTPVANGVYPGKDVFALQLNEDGFGPSDHSSFYGKKIPVLFFFTGTHNDYHKPTDTFDKINYEGLSWIEYYVGKIIESVDQNPTKPTYTVAKSSGQMGQVRLSVSLGTIPNYADSTDGMIIDGVRDNSPAAKAGLQPGDKITKLAGKDVRNAMDYTYVLGSMKPGEEYEVEIIRGTQRMTLKVIPAAPARRP